MKIDKELALRYADKCESSAAAVANGDNKSRLYAAAHALRCHNDLLEALQMVMRDVVPHVRETGHNAADREASEAIIAARAAIARATGATQ